MQAERGARREAQLRALLAEYVDRARALREVAREAWDAAEAAQSRLTDEQQHRGDSGLAVLRERADAMTLEAAQLQLDAYERSVEAAAAATVVGMARRGMAWLPASDRPVDDANDPFRVSRPDGEPAPVSRAARSAV
ncbi:hypothetical protein LPC08_25605 (plasmid) [Roseomonas sp. OT10]|uniref:hypothetical protein n=1 Tax=Roseomonas cutis TaxID=2897332 RepID=UPI001E3A6A8F|nr:hypothetical protein [Roseomonas sp. OT10]UFN51636.1 hypothetical protein LPC08_25605 [Roseomonas sp. OT10]